MEQHLDRDLASEVRRFVRERQNKLANASNSGEVIETLNDVVELFLRGTLLPFQVSLDKRPVLKGEFVSNHFVRFSEFILSSKVIEFYSNLNEQQKKDGFEVFFLRGPSHDCLLVLGDVLSKPATNLKNAKVIVSLLEKFFGEERLVDILVEQCRLSRPSKNGSLNSSVTGFESKLWGQLVTLIVSLPQRVANKLRFKCSPQFYPESYFNLVSCQIIKALEKLHDNLTMSQDCSFKFLEELIGRICLVGQAERMFAILLPALEKWLKKSPLWNRICARLVTGIPDGCMEHVTEGLLKMADDPSLISKLFGDSVLTNTKLKYLLTSKFLLMRSYTNMNVLYNIMGYLSGYKHRHLLVETLHTLFDIWGDRSAIKHTTYDQHFYITCATVLSFGHLNIEERKSEKHVLLNKLLVGVQSHLESPLEKVQRLGMVVAECLTSSLEPNGEKLVFGYMEDSDTKQLKSLAKGPQERMNLRSVGKRNEPDVEIKGKDKLVTEESSSMKVSAEKNSPQICEGDDDLVPYDLGEEDDSDLKSKAPKYLRDCIEGLLASEDSSKMEASLKNVEKLVGAEMDDLDDVCEELVKVLLHLQDQFSTDMFGELRHSAIVAVLIRCPEQIACYLTEEFFAPNYHLQQRMDILSVLADAAQQLSTPVEITKTKEVPRRFPLPQAESNKCLQAIPEWQKIVQERIDGKTKRFTKGPSHPQPKPVANKFASVAGYFFFPLMKNFDSKVNTLDLLGEDTLVLGRLVYTLGIIMYSARETPTARNMGKALLEFTWALKYHSESFVRQALIFAQAMVAVSVPSSILMNDAPGELSELHDWLKTIVQNDTDADSVRAAFQTLVLLEEIFKNQVVVHV